MKTTMLAGISRCLVLVAIAASLPALSGCAGYRLGNTLPKDLKTVYVPTFINKTDEPMVETEVTRAVIQALQMDGSLEVVGQEFADSILEVTLVSIKFQPLSYQQDSRRTANEYRLYVTADIVFKRAKTSQVLTKRQVVGEGTFLPAGDIASAKRAALPTVAKDLAHRIVEAVVEYW